MNNRPWRADPSSGRNAADSRLLTGVNFADVRCAFASLAAAESAATMPSERAVTLHARSNAVPCDDARAYNRQAQRDVHRARACRAASATITASCTWRPRHRNSPSRARHMKVSVAKWADASRPARRASATAGADTRLFLGAEQAVIDGVRIEPQTVTGVFHA